MNFRFTSILHYITLGLFIVAEEK